MECSLFEFSLMDWSNVTAVEELFTDSSPPSTLERVPVGQSSRIDFWFEDP